MNHISKKFVGMLIIGLSVCCLVGCGGAGNLNIPEPLPDDRQDIPCPKKRKVYEIDDGIDQQVARQVEQAFDLSRHIRWIFGSPKQAYNVNALDEVPNSSWFTNRNGVRSMSLEEIKRGPNTGSGPDMSGEWTIVAAKPSGVTPGFTIEDAQGGRYVLKFDPKGYDELTTGAEVVSTKIFYAAGYNTPENYLVYFDPRILTLEPGVEFRDKTGKKRVMIEKDLEEILGRIPYRPDGTVRAVASKFLEGKIVGPFKYYKTRKDDPNDIVPHEHRRELRALSVISAWMNNYDTKAANTLDVYVEDNGHRFVKHYLIDFGSTLGSRGDMPMPDWVGFEHTYDPTQLLKNTVTLGFHVPKWEQNRVIHYPSVGLFDNEGYDPKKYKFIHPTIAFENRTKSDTFWAAKIVMSFTDEQIRAAVETGEYSKPEAAEYLISKLIERRDITARYWFDRVNPLDKFEIIETREGERRLRFADLAVEYGFDSTSDTKYRYELRGDGKTIGAPVEIGTGADIPLPPTEQKILEVRIRTKRHEEDKWGKYVSAYMETKDNPGGYSLVALERQE